MFTSTGTDMVNGTMESTTGVFLAKSATDDAGVNGVPTAVDATVLTAAAMAVVADVPGRARASNRFLMGPERGGRVRDRSGPRAGGRGMSAAD